MDLWSAISLGFREIWSHKFRSLLTMLGIILGVSSLIAMSAMVKGMEKGMTEALIAVGGLEKVRIEAQDVPPEQRHLRDQAVGVTLNDVVALKESAPLVKAMSPEMRLFGGVMTKGNKRFRPWGLAGVWPEALAMTEHVVEHGRMFNEVDDDLARNVCVIGSMAREELFGKLTEEEIPKLIGQTVHINNQPFTIVGLLQHYESEQDKKARELKEKEEAAMGGAAAQTGPQRSRGWGGGSNRAFMFKNSAVFIPLNTMWLRFRSGGGGLSRGDNVAADPRLSTLEVKIASFEDLTPALQQIQNVLMSTHKGIEDFSFRTQEDWADTIRAFIENTRLSRGLIAAISLLVGGIGIMNIMLASITERVREIGIRKSVGATDRDVFVQIMVESVVIAMLGGFVGIAASFGVLKLIEIVAPADNTPVVTLVSVLVAFGFSVGIGLVAGLIPAIKASRLHPIQALRYD